MPPPDAETLATWAKADTASLRAAARLYNELAAKKRGTRVTASASLATRYRMPVHAIDTAKHVLASLQVIHNGPGNRWYVT
jgi:hypothetical protein